MKLMKAGTRLGVLNAMFLRSIYVVAHDLLFYCQVIFYCKNTSQFIFHSPVSEHLGCFQIGAVMLKDITFLHRSFFCRPMASFFLGM